MTQLDKEINPTRTLSTDLLKFLTDIQPTKKKRKGAFDDLTSPTPVEIRPFYGFGEKFILFEEKISKGKVGLSEFYLEKCRQLCPICANTVYYFREAPTDLLPPSRCNQWSERENAFLTGIVTSVYLRRHSLKPTNTEKKEYKMKGSSSQKIIWQCILKTYHEACDRYYRLTGEKTPRRTVEALQKHWKESGIRTTNENEYDIYHCESKRLAQLWDERYNSFFALSCPNDVFASLLSQMKKSQTTCLCSKSLF